MSDLEFTICSNGRVTLKLMNKESVVIEPFEGNQKPGVQGGASYLYKNRLYKKVHMYKGKPCIYCKSENKYINVKSLPKKGGTPTEDETCHNGQISNVPMDIARVIHDKMEDPFSKHALRLFFALSVKFNLPLDFFTEAFMSMQRALKKDLQNEGAMFILHVGHKHIFKVSQYNFKMVDFSNILKPKQVKLTASCLAKEFISLIQAGDVVKFIVQLQTFSEYKLNGVIRAAQNRDVFTPWEVRYRRPFETRFKKLICRQTFEQGKTAGHQDYVLRCTTSIQDLIVYYNKDGLKNMYHTVLKEVDEEKLKEAINNCIVALCPSQNISDSKMKDRVAKWKEYVFDCCGEKELQQMLGDKNATPEQIRYFHHLLLNVPNKFHAVLSDLADFVSECSQVNKAQDEEAQREFCEAKLYGLLHDSPEYFMDRWVNYDLEPSDDYLYAY